MTQPDREGSGRRETQAKSQKPKNAFLEKAADLAPAIQGAQEGAMHFATLAEKFRQEPSLQTLRDFVAPLSTPEGLPAIDQASQAIRTVTEAWRESSLADKTISQGGVFSYWDFWDPRSVGEKIGQLEEEKRDLKKNKISAARNLLKIRQINSQIAAAERRLELYHAHITPKEEQVLALRRSINASADLVAEFARRDLPERLAQEAPTALHEELAKPDVQALLESAWVNKMVREPLGRMADIMVVKRRREQDAYSEVDEQMDRASFSLLVDDYTRYVATEVRRRASPDFNPREQTDNPFLAKFEELGLEEDFWRLNQPLTLSLSVDSQRTNIKDAYELWGSVIESSPDGKDWEMPTLGSEIDFYLSLSLRNIEYAVQSALRSRKLGGIQQLPINELIAFPAMDRFLVIKDYLVEKRLYPKDKLQDIEDTIIARLMNEALLPGGPESWPGTDAAGALRRLGSPKALEPLLYFQTYVSGARGSYSAGHTNSVVQGVLENILSRTSPEEIRGLGLPRFIEESLLLVRDVSEDPMGDTYGRSYLTAATVAGRVSEALAEIKTNWEDPTHQKWIPALLRGMKNSRQPFSSETYGEIMSLLELDDSQHMQNNVVEMLAFRIHNREQLGITARINPDFPVALETFVKLMDSPNFDKSQHNIEAIHHVMRQLQTAVHLSHWTGAELAQLKIYYASVFQTTIGVPDLEQMDLAHHYKEEIANRLKKWLEDPDLPNMARYLIIQTFKSADINYPNSLEEIKKLFEDKELARQAYDLESWGDFSKTNFLDEVNSHGYYECLTNLLLEKYFEGDTRARDLIVSSFVNLPETRKGITNYFIRYAPYEPTPEQETRMDSVLDEFNKHLLVSDDPEMVKAIVDFFTERSYMRDDQRAAQLLIADVEQLDGERQQLVFKALVDLVRNFERVVGKEIPEGLSDGGKAQRFMQDTVKSISEKMWGFLDSTDIEQQFWAVYTLNLYNESGERFREALDNLLSARHDLETLNPNVVQFLDKMKERIEEQDKPS